MNCVDCVTTELVVERSEPSHQWQCYCPECLDGEYIEGKLRACNPIGTGRTRDEAIADYVMITEGT